MGVLICDLNIRTAVKGYKVLNYPEDDYDVTPNEHCYESTADKYYKRYGLWYSHFDLSVIEERNAQGLLEIQIKMVCPMMNMWKDTLC